MTSTRWCFTLNNYTAYEKEDIDKMDVKYSIYGHEKGAEGTPHLQGYAIFRSNKRLSALKKIVPRAHWEIAKGTTEHNIKYCSKEGDVTETGDRPVTAKQKGEAEKERWKQIILHAKQGTLEEHDPKVYYNTLNTALKLQAQYEKPIAITKKVQAFYGPTSTGKSHEAWVQAGPDAYVKDPRSKFWYGYHGQENVIIDEFRGGIDIAHILRWTDRYPCLVEVKGSSCALKCVNIWFTSNLHPSAWYPDLDADTQAALLRRLKVTHFNGDLGKYHK